MYHLRKKQSQLNFNFILRLFTGLKKKDTKEPKANEKDSNSKREDYLKSPLEDPIKRNEHTFFAAIQQSLSFFDLNKADNLMENVNRNNSDLNENSNECVDLNDIIPVEEQINEIKKTTEL